MRTRLHTNVHVSVATDKGTELNSVYTCIMRTRLHTCINTVATELNSVMRTRLHTCIFINTEATESKLHTIISCLVEMSTADWSMTRAYKTHAPGL